MRSSNLALLVLLALPCATAVAASDSDPQFPEFSARVQLSISDQGDLRDMIQSFLATELRKLTGVTVVDSDPEWVINVIAFRTKTRTGIETGYAISFVVSVPTDLEWIRSIPKYSDGKIDEATLRLVSVAVRDTATLRDHQLRVGPMHTLRSECEELVASFDAQLLEPQRQVHQSVKDALGKPKT